MFQIPGSETDLQSVDIGIEHLIGKPCCSHWKEMVRFTEAVMMVCKQWFSRYSWKLRCHTLSRIVLGMVALTIWTDASSDAIISRGLNPEGIGAAPTYIVAVGISQYSAAPAVPDLRFATEEAEQIYQIVTHAETGVATIKGSQLLTGKNATRKNILHAVATIGKQLKDNETLIFYWSGHSTRAIGPGQDDDVKLIPYDYNPDATKSAISMLADVITAAVVNPHARVVMIGDGCHIGGALYKEAEKKYPNLVIISSSKMDEIAFDDIDGSPFFRAFSNALRAPSSDFDNDGFVSLEEAFISLYPDTTRVGFGRQHPTMTGQIAHKIAAARIRMAGVDLETPLPLDMLRDEHFTINGSAVNLDRHASTQNHLVFLGNSSGIFSRGVNYLESKKSQLLYWKEEQSLKSFEVPYKRSAAIIVAIDDYERKSDPLKRGPTGFASRDNMVSGAKNVKLALMRYGFHQQDIVELYDGNATSERIDRELKRFWQGGDRSSVDRVFFYFGGHGSTYDGQGVLITYDFNPAMPTQSGVLMKDLSTRHAENMASRQVLFALDSCASGLALYKTLGNETQPVPASTQNLSVIRADSSGRARNFLVAGTGDQPALWENGGIFTQELVAGLNGGADSNNDNILQFSELANFVRNHVSARAAKSNTKQLAQDYSLSALGDGRMLFLRSLEKGN